MKMDSVRAMIYEDPISRERPEGVAKIIVEYGGPDRDGNVQCDVVFNGDAPDMLVNRRVHLSEMTTAG